MIQHLRKLPALTLALLAASPVAATPNLDRELQLETEERLEQVSEESKSPSLPEALHFLEGFNFTWHEFYGPGVTAPIITWKHRHDYHSGYRGHYDRNGYPVRGGHIDRYYYSDRTLRCHSGVGVNIEGVRVYVPIHCHKR